MAVEVTTGDPLASRIAYIGRDGFGDFFGEVMDLTTKWQTVFEKGLWPDVEAALAWARASAYRVVVAYGDNEGEIFSAGEVPCQWPDGVDFA
jgi:hypothetical protein